MSVLRVAAFAVLVVLAGGPVLTVICEAGCAPVVEAAGTSDASCHSTAGDAADDVLVGGRTSAGCDHRATEQAIRPTPGASSGVFHKAVVASVEFSDAAHADSRGPAAGSRAPAPPDSAATGFALPLRI